ncbi:bifunctional tetrahydrofolate synthase/dihydrofolate synthase [Marinimicrobium agarilyticum]|uniref:bifunctional tetrahydrofolate synthase/dihydrofolate synthase n=1 Tax=Marinimicrobium agarilyticum TaxID=306546 RepID=UPI0004241DBB|nr:bifunctional tetrahydrofolate synthase/dihydrofolate synthase [Marinimicrobium agarilyticum]
MRFERLDDWLRWLESHHPTEIELGLTRIRVVAERLDLLTPSARVISVAGTNGKGSCVAACGALLQAAGCSVGTYTSPHLLRYNERVVIDGAFASDDELCQAFARIDEASPDISLTYFEFGTLAALDIFQRRRVDVMVLEVGLGGRLDAVNILDADVAIVTSVDLDHQAWLGNDRDSIGREKAGIYRAGRPALCADPAPPEGLLAAVAERGVQLQRLGTDFGFSSESEGWRWWGSGADDNAQSVTLPEPTLPWPSLAAALQAVAQLGFDASALAVSVGLSTLTLAGRYQRFDWRGRTVIMDVAHNPAAARHLASRLARETFPRTLALAAIMADKDRGATLAPLVAQVQHWWLAALPDVPRAATVDQLTLDLKTLGAEADGCGTLERAIDWLLSRSSPGDRIVVMGSFFTVGAALSAWAHRGERLEPAAPGAENTELLDE